MKKLFNVSRSHLASTFLVLALSCSAVFSQDARSPVGSWELSIARTGRSAKETGTVFITFNTNNTLTGYGLTTASFDVFTLSGTWSLDSKGKLMGAYTQVEFGELLDATFTGRVNAGKKIQLNAEGLLGTFKFEGVPMQPLPDLCGSWSSSVSQVNTKFKSVETYQFTNRVEFPGVSDITGSGTNNNGAFTVSGAAIVTSKGEVTAFKLNDFGGDEMTSDALKGQFRERKEMITLLGNDVIGLDVIPVRARFSRP